MSAEKTIDVKAGGDISVNTDANANITATKDALVEGSMSINLNGGTAANVKAGVIKLN